MRVFVRIALVVLTFLGVGWLVMHLLVARAIAHGSAEYTVRMGGALGGLFAGGAAATLVALPLLLGGRRPSQEG